jgi:GNAT superfamily N-acetyltransferase
MNEIELTSARDATAADIDTIVTLASLVIDELRDERGGSLLLFHDLGSVGQANTYRDCLEDAASSVVVGLIDGSVVGFGLARVVRSDHSQICMIDQLVVHPDARGIGVGAMILASVRRWGVEAGCQMIESQVLPGNRAAKNFFERVGMVTRKMQVSTEL